MIITALIKLILNLLGVLLVFDLPALPEALTNTLDSILGYMVEGLAIIRAFVGDGCMSLLATVFSMVLLAESMYFTYTLVF